MYNSVVPPLRMLTDVNEDIVVELAPAWMNNTSDQVEHFVKLVRFAGHPYTLILWRAKTDGNLDDWQANVVATHEAGPGVYVVYDLFSQFRCHRKGRTQRDAKKLAVRCALLWLRLAFGVDRFEDVFQEVV